MYRLWVSGAIFKIAFHNKTWWHQWWWKNTLKKNKKPFKVNIKLFHRLMLDKMICMFRDWNSRTNVVLYFSDWCRSFIWQICIFVTFLGVFCCCFEIRKCPIFSVRPGKNKISVFLNCLTHFYFIFSTYLMWSDISKLCYVIIFITVSIIMCFLVNILQPYNNIKNGRKNFTEI